MDSIWRTLKFENELRKDQEMKRGMLGAIFYSLVFFNSIAVSALDKNVENSTLQEILKSMTPTITDFALSATFVRTNYMPQIQEDFSANKGLEVKRTTISEILVNSEGVKESVCDARKTKSLVKQYAFHYSNDGIHTKIYDSRNKRGSARKSSDPSSNYLSFVLSPYVAARQRRFISRAMPVLQTKFNEARIASETSSVRPEGICITLEGEYKNSDPERHFKITVIPAFNYAAVEFEEYDKNKRILTEITKASYVKVPGTSNELWLPKQTIVKRYRYDDYEGNTVQVAKLDILEQKAVAADENMFSLIFPPDSKVYDATLDVDLEKAREEIDSVALEAIDDLLESPILADEKGKAIVARARDAYEQDNIVESTNESVVRGKAAEQTVVPTAQSRTLQMPKSDTKVILIKIFQALVVIAILVTLFCILYRRRGSSNSGGMFQRR